MLRNNKKEAEAWAGLFKEIVDSGKKPSPKKRKERKWQQRQKQKNPFEILSKIDVSAYSEKKRHVYLLIMGMGCK